MNPTSSIPDTSPIWCYQCLTVGVSCTAYAKIIAVCWKPLTLLHDIGITINFYSHARHSAYMILNAKLFGLTHKEQVITAAIAGWHNGVSKNYFKDRFYKELLSDANWKQSTSWHCCWH